ncbi:MAG: hypothetical protein KDE19_18505 [Caldilineaceae bacterium]|nr:hypothetical protein [Caldilineaceae bacterium]
MAQIGHGCGGLRSCPNGAVTIEVENRLTTSIAFIYLWSAIVSNQQVAILITLLTQ